jgi:hypothetical protein
MRASIPGATPRIAKAPGCLIEALARADGAPTGAVVVENEGSDWEK